MGKAAYFTEEQFTERNFQMSPLVLKEDLCYAPQHPLQPESVLFIFI